MDDVKTVERAAAWDAAVLMMYTVALGKTLVGEARWRGDRPETSAEAVRFASRCECKSLVLVASVHVQRHQNMIRALRHCAAQSGSKWKFTTEKLATIPVNTCMHVLEDLPCVCENF